MGGPSPRRSFNVPEFPDLSLGLPMPFPITVQLIPLGSLNSPAVIQGTFLLPMSHSGTVSPMASLGNLAVGYGSFL